MPLTATNFYVKGPVASADLNQFYNLFTGVMVDQPVTFANVLSVGGQQGAATVPLKLYGATGQTTHLIDLYADRSQAQPGFGFSAIGSFGWGPGGTSPTDTFLSRIASQVGHTSDTPGLLVAPSLEVDGNVLAHGEFTFPSGAALSANGLTVNAGVNLAVQQDLFVGYDLSTYLHQVSSGHLGLEPTLLINGANGAAAGLTYGSAHLQTRGNDIPDTAGSWSYPLSAQAFSANWLQFNPKFYKVTAGVGWPGIALLLDYDVDNNSAAGGRMSLGSAILVDLGNATLGTTARIQSGTDVIVGNGSLYLGGQADTVLQRAAANVLSTPGTLQVAQAVTVGTTLGVGGIQLSATSVNELHVTNASITLDVPRVFGWPNESVSPGENIGRSNTVYLSPHAYVFFDLGVGHTITCQSLNQTSDPNLKAGATVLSDPNCMQRVRANVPVYTYQLTPPSPPPSGGGGPVPTPNDIGLMATDVYSTSPEFVSLDANNNPVGLSYPNMAALLWGALRNLDQRCTAFGVPS